MRLLLATHNEHKRRELARLLDGCEVELLPDAVTLPPEDGETFAENALGKARAAAGATGAVTIADDSGIEARALGGAPGVRSARYAGDNASDSDNNQKLLAALKNIPDERRAARFVSVMVYLRNAEDTTPVIAQGSWRGTILHNPRGANGFGYDPLFFVPDLKRSAAELDAEVKNRASHRGKAARHLFSMINDAG